MRRTCLLLGALGCCAAEQVALGADATVARHGARSDSDATALMRGRRALASAAATYNGTVADAAAYNAKRSALRAAVLDGYDRTTPPPNASVSLQLMLKQVVDLNTVAQTVDMMTWWRHSWLDPRLAWDPAAYGGISKLVFKGFGTLWVPDTMVRDRARAATVGG